MGKNDIRLTAIMLSLSTKKVAIEESTLKCQINRGSNKQWGQKKIPKFNKWGVKINGGQNLRNDLTDYKVMENTKTRCQCTKLKYIQKHAIFALKIGCTRY